MRDYIKQCSPPSLLTAWMFRSAVALKKEMFLVFQQSSTFLSVLVQSPQPKLSSWFCFTKLPWYSVIRESYQCGLEANQQDTVSSTVAWEASLHLRRSARSHSFLTYDTQFQKGQAHCKVFHFPPPHLYGSLYPFASHQAGMCLTSNTGVVGQDFNCQFSGAKTLKV